VLGHFRSTASPNRSSPPVKGSLERGAPTLSRVRSPCLRLTRWCSRWQCSSEEGAAGSASSAPVAHGEHSRQGEEAVEWVGMAALQRWWGTTAIVDDHGRLQCHPWNRREVSISSIKIILWSVGCSLNGGRNNSAQPKIWWRAGAPTAEKQTNCAVERRGRRWRARTWMGGRNRDKRRGGALGGV
jgi:hypothetical protein